MASLLDSLFAVTAREQQLIAQANGYDGGVVVGPPDKRAAIVDAAAAFATAGTTYALIGGVAVGIRSGVPRATLDVDFAVPSAMDRGVLIAAFLSHPFTLVGEFTHSVNLKHASGEPVQIAFDLVFDPMIARAQPVALDALALPVVTTADLIEMKKLAAADPKRRRSKALRDQADVALLEGDVPDPDEGW